MSNDITLENVVARLIELDKKYLKLEKELTTTKASITEFSGILKAISVALESININQIAANQFARERLDFDKQDFEFRKTISAQIREERQNHKPTTETPAPGVIDPTLLKWTLFPKGSGEWAFATEKDGSPLGKAQPLVEAIKRANGKLTMDGYIYSLSRDGKFLNRKAA